MEIRIEIDRPVATLLTIGGIVGFMLVVQHYTLTADDSVRIPELQASVLEASGGTDTPVQVAVKQNEEEIRRERQRQVVIDRRVEILQYQIQQLEDQYRLLGGEDDPDLTLQFAVSTRMLRDLLKDKQLSEQRILDSLTQMREAQGRALTSARDLGLDFDVSLMWPIEPIYGVSAGFLDADYESFFGIPHHAVDIPALQGTEIVAAEDGVVEEVVDNGLGYSWVTVRHEGFVTLYGHVSDVLVAPGRYVWKGDPIAKSGGMPGTPGAGSLSTGPHLHFELMMQSGHVNPLHYLPRREGIAVSHDW